MPERKILRWSNQNISTGSEKSIFLFELLIIF